MNRNLDKKRRPPSASTLADEIVVTIRDRAGRRKAVVIRNSHETIRLDGRDYQKFRIINPAGFEGEDIFHRPDLGSCDLLSVVFTTLAEASPRSPERKRPAALIGGRNEA